MAIRLSGLTSGLDTDAIVKELVSAYNLKTQKYEKAQTKLQWKQDTWKSLNSKIYSLYTSVSNLRYSSYDLKKSNVSDATKAKVTASGTAATGTQKLNIKQVAQAGYLTGGELKADDGKTVTSQTTLEELGYDGDKTTIRIDNKDGTVKTIEVNKTSKISDIVSALKKDTDLNVNFDENNQRIFISAKASGEDNDFVLLGGDSNGDDVLSALGLNTALLKQNDGGSISFTEAGKVYEEYYNYYKEAEGKGITDINAYLQSLLSDYNLKQSQNSEFKELEKNVSKLNEEIVSSKKERDELEEKKAVRDAYDAIGTVLKGADPTLSDDDIESIINFCNKNGEIDASNENFKEKLKELSLSSGDKIGQENAEKLITALTSEDNKEKVKENLNLVNEYTSKHSGVVLKDIKIDEEALEGLNSDIASKETQLSDEEQELERLKEQFNVDANNEFLEKYSKIGDIVKSMEDASKKGTSEEEIAEIKEKAIAEMAAKIEEAHTLYNDVKNNTNTSALQGSASKIKGSNAEIILNGVTYTSSSNTFSINGLTIEVMGTTDDGDNILEEEDSISITTTTDAQGIYDKIKDFLAQYNEVINEMTKLYNADSAKGYEPLTDDEKEAMSEEEIEKWEKKIKDSLLRRDTTLSGIMSVMTNIMSQSIVVGGTPVTDTNGKVVKDSYGNTVYAENTGTKLTLSSFGIQTLGFLNAGENEHNAYHIYGDEEDENTASKEDKLMKAIMEDPDQVEEFMKTLTSKLYTAIDSKMKSTTLSSAYKVYNDKEMDKQLTNYAKLIKEWEDKIADKEEYYYKKFTAMETALSKLQEQTNSLNSLLGM